MLYAIKSIDDTNLCIHICICALQMHVCEYAHVCMRVHVEARGQPQMPSLKLSPLSVLRQSLPVGSGTHQ